MIRPKEMVFYLIMTFGLLFVFKAEEYKVAYYGEEYVVEKAQEDIEWQRCGQYNLDYYEADNGFYNCIKRN